MTTSPSRLLLCVVVAAACVIAPVASQRGVAAADCVAGSSGSVAVDDPTPHFSQLRADYRLRVRLRLEPARLDVSARIDICNAGASSFEQLHLTVLPHAFGEMRILETRLDGRPVEASFAVPGDMLVVLPEGLPPGSRTRLEVDYRLRPSDDVSTSLQARLSRSDGLLLVADWFPLLSDGHGLRSPGDSKYSAAAERIRLELTTDRPLVVAAPGRPVRIRGSRHIYGIGDARDHAFLVARRLVGAEVRTDRGVRVVAFARDEGQARVMAGIARQALETYERAYGPYPWRRLVVAPTPRRLGGHEYPGIVFVGTGWIEGLEPIERRWLRANREGRWLGLEAVLTHEVAHQWFYALVGSDQLREPWLDEALAEFTAHHFFSPLDLDTCAAGPVGRSAFEFPAVPPASDCDGYTETVYRRGAVMVDGVRRLMGDEAFFAAMREYVADNRFSIASADDLVGVWLAHADDPALLEAYVRWYLEGETGVRTPPRGTGLSPR